MTDETRPAAEADPGLVAGRYRAVRPIGRGGMGTVWLATDERLGRAVAIKRLGAFPGETEVQTARAMREARHAAALNHPNVVAVYDVAQHEGTPWLVMEHVDGPTLSQAVRARGPMRPRGAADLGAQLAAALTAAHAAGVVHRDIKPANVLIGDRRPKLADFGTARAGTDDQLTSTGLVTGTPTYMAPEVAEGHDPGEAADLWALGATLYFAVEGRDAYPSQGNPLATLRQIATTDPDPATNAGPLAPVLARLMDRDPGRRGTAAQARDDLRRVAEGRTVADSRPAAPSPVTPSRVAPSSPAGRDGNRWLPWTVGAVVLLLVLGLVGLLAGSRYGAGGPSDPTGGAGAGQQTSAAGAETPGEKAPYPTEEVTTFVTEHYGRLASDPAAAWGSLTPEVQAQAGGEEAYLDLWSSYSSVSASEVEVDEQSGRVTFVLSRAKGDEPATVSDQTITVVREGDGLRIASVG